ncbi:Cytidylate kinase-like family protein [Verrucomicrobium sp. GAS474]|uniref:cytidylate kinase-like family protein n=1 Tax=Verrucomicrobium sp. GAS474 TaxID=1882831 RepID=UPI00087C01A5|nr:cytidylate kinase-like family protein [Verrucomicrobium sp. GAS474]SDU00296.1 Cytidylate kinase-like family protein [Verrucomicrobium sp. GAS474]
MNTPLSPLAAYLNTEGPRHHSLHPAALDHPGPVITLSREEGAGGEAIARLAGTILSERGPHPRPWLVFDDELAARIVRDHHLPDRIRAFLTDEQTSAIDDIVEELVGLHPDRFLLVQKMIETILGLAKIGRAIFVGRASHIVLMGMPEARHIRIVGTLEERAKRLADPSALPGLSPLSLAEARARAKKIDRARMRFIGHYFHRDIDDPHGYDMTLNTDRLSLEEAARMVAALVPDSTVPFL